MQIGHWFFKSCRIFVAVALCQRETFLCHSLWQRANTWSIMFENLQGGQFNYVINSVDSTKLPCYTLPQTQHHGFTLIYSYILFIIKLFQNNFINLFFKSFFFAIGDPICDLVRDPIQSDPGFVKVSPFLLTHSHNYFCMNMYHIIAVRFRCWCFDLTVVHIHSHSRLCSACAWLQKGTVF